MRSIDFPVPTVNLSRTEAALLPPTQTMPALVRNDLPKHIACIMDGNGRWAQARGLPRAAGHKAGAESVRECVETCLELGIEWLTLYAFSSENWQRPESEVEALMGLLERFLTNQAKEMDKRNVKLHAIGQLDRLPPSTRKCLEKALDRTKNNTDLNLVLALSYGSREEISDAVKKISTQVANGELSPDSITPSTIRDHLYTADMPDPDLLVRTSGEMRLSNFLLWQLSYTEIVVTQKLWPDFRRSEFNEAISEYQRRHRRYGRVETHS